MIAPLDIIFLDIDGVLLPFGGESDHDNVKGSANKENKNKNTSTRKTSLNKNQEPTPWLFPKSTLGALNSIIKRNDSPIYLVLSSTWRVQHTWVQQIEDCIRRFRKEEMEKKMKRNMNKKSKNHNDTNKEDEDYTNPIFFGMTNLNNHSERQWEIHEWLQTHAQSQSRPIRSWIALDDEELISGKKNQRHRSQFIGHVVKTESDVGLTLNDANLASKLLKKQQHAYNNKAICSSENVVRLAAIDINLLFQIQKNGLGDSQQNKPLSLVAEDYSMTHN